MNEEKKEYIKPKMEILELNHESALLDCSIKDEYGGCVVFDG